MILPFCLSRLTEIEKRLTIKCGDSMCRPKVYDEFIRYIVLYRKDNWWFRYYIVKQLKGMAQANYEMYCERHREGE